CAIACWVMVLVGVPIVIGSGMLIVATGVGIGVLVAKRRSTQQEALIRTLAIAASRELPLPPALEAVSDFCSGDYRRKVRALAFYLDRGVPLTEALDREPGVFPRDAALLTRIGWETGTLPGALREIELTRVTLRPAWTGIAGRIAYLMFVLWVLQS